jgi:hypothetical protein
MAMASETSHKTLLARLRRAKLNIELLWPDVGQPDYENFENCHHYYRVIQVFDLKVEKTLYIAKLTSTYDVVMHRVL